jgi:hypothetical protein
VGGVDLDRARSRQGGYVVVEGRRVARYRIDHGLLVFDVDEACFSDAAEALLPRIVDESARFIDHLVRPMLAVRGQPAGAPAPSATSRPWEKLVWRGPALARARLLWVAEDRLGRRRLVGQRELAGVRPGARLASTLRPLPPDPIVALVLRGLTAAGDPLTTVLALSP